MTKSSLDIYTAALRRIGVLDAEEVPEAHEAEQASDLLAAEFARLVAVQGFGWTFTADTVPDELFRPMSDFLASVLAPEYGKAGPSEARAIGQMRAFSFPDDREDPRDLDGDGTVSEAEEAIADRARFY